MPGPEERILRRPSGAVRLIFSYDGDDVRLLSRRRVEMTLPPGDPITPAGAAGFFSEVRKDDGEVLERRVMPDPLRGDTEVFSDDPERSVARTAVDRPQGAFTVVVPDYVEAAQVALIAAQPAPAEGGGERLAAAPLREVALVPLHPGDEDDGGAE